MHLCISSTILQFVAILSLIQPTPTKGGATEFGISFEFVLGFSEVL